MGANNDSPAAVTDETRQKVTFTFSIDLDRPGHDTGKAMSQELADALRNVAGVTAVQEKRWSRQ